MSTNMATPMRTNWTAVTALGVAVFMAAVDMTIVAVALPVIGRAFNTDPATTQWIVLSYTFL
jgi:DHA2 family multidrug resistance protein-like MFS transporter